jgi:hypothetical protein
MQAQPFRAGWSRRAFLQGIAVAAAVVGAPWARDRRAACQSLPVLSLYMDEPYIDLQGRELAYEARGFTDGVGPLQAWSEQQWRMHHPYI